MNFSLAGLTAIIVLHLFLILQLISCFYLWHFNSMMVGTSVLLWFVTETLVSYKMMITYLLSENVVSSLCCPFLWLFVLLRKKSELSAVT